MDNRSLAVRPSGMATPGGYPNRAAPDRRGELAAGIERSAQRRIKAPGNAVGRGPNVRSMDRNRQGKRHDRFGKQRVHRGGGAGHRRDQAALRRRARRGGEGAGRSGRARGAAVAGIARRRHVLLEGVPGLAKTLSISTLAATIECRFSRNPVHPGHAAGRRHRHAGLQSAQRHLFRAQGGRCSATWCWPTKSTGRRPRCRRRCWRRCRSGRSPWARRPSPWSSLPGDGHPEPHRAGRYVSAARSPARPLHHEAAGGLSES